MANPGKSATSLRDRLLDSAELLLARDGATGVSLRQISAAAGTRNNYAVQYHFGDIDGLIRAILERRAPMIDRKRGALLTQSAGSGPLGTRQLIEIILRPLLEADGANKPSIFARFELVLLSSVNGLALLDDIFAERPVTRHLMELIAIANQPIPAPITWRRLQTAALTVLAAGVSTYIDEDTQEYYDAALRDAFNMAAAALMTPVEEGAALLGDSSHYLGLRSAR